MSLPEQSAFMMAWRIARRDLRGGLGGVQIFLLCLALGVASIAAVGSVRQAIDAGMTREAAIILGGDAEISFTHRFATDAERTFMRELASQVSETVDFRSMAVAGSERALTQVRGVDRLWPLYGRAGTDPEVAPNTPLQGANGEPGALMDPILAERLGLMPGDQFNLGTQVFELVALLVDEPDAGGSGFALGPRTIVPLWGLDGSGLLGPGTIYDSQYRLALPEGSDLGALQTRVEARMGDSGLRWRDTRAPAPGVAEFVDRMGAFLVLVGLAGLAVGGVGISASVRSYLSAKIATIATLRTLGAETSVIFGVYLIQIALMAVLGLVLGLALGAGLPVLFTPLIVARLPVPIDIGLYPGPLAEAGLYGLIAAFLFAIWPLARTGQVRAAALYRDGSSWGGLPERVYLFAIGALAVALIGAATLLSGMAMLALGMAVGIVGALGLLALAARAIRAIARLIRPRLRGRTALRAALAAIGAPGSDAVPVVLSLGLGLGILATMGQVDANLRAAIARDLPQVAPSYFFVDIQTDQIAAFADTLSGDGDVSRVDTAPMLRGTVTRINGQPAAEVAGEHWVIQGDRGVTFASEAPADGEIVAGSWWPDDYSGPPLLAFAAVEAAEMGIGLGDSLTVNVLGREITAEVAALREVDFSNASIGFVLTFSPNALGGAPHTYIATVYAEEAAEARILREIGSAMPNVTAIRVRDAIDQVTQALTGLAQATALGASVTLITGFVVLIGAAAAGEPGRIREAAILKTLGAARGTILTSFALRSAILGAAAGVIAVLAGALGGWAVLESVMDSTFSFEWVSAILIVLGGALISLLAGLAFAWRPLAARPASILRHRG